MATIPLYNDGRMPGVPEAAPKALVPEARYEADYAGLARAAAQAYEQPELPENWGKGEAMAAQAWGQALQTLGKTVQVVVEETAKIKNEGDIANADARMTETLGAYEIGLEENSQEDTWVTGWEKQVAGLRKEFESDRSLSPYAKHHIGMRLQRMEVAGKVRISSMAMSSQRQKASLSLDNLERMHREQGNYAGMRAVNQRRLDVHLQDPQQAQARSDAIDAMERSDGLYAAIDTNPKVAREQLDVRDADGKPVHFSWLDPLNRERAKSHADQVLQDRRARIMEEVVEFVSTNDGQPIYPDDIDAFDPNGYLNAAQRADVRSFVAGVVPRNRKADFEQAASIIDNYRKLDDPSGYRLADLKYSISTSFEGPYKEELVGRLNNHLNALEKALPPMGEVTATLNYWMERGAFGEYTKPKQKDSGPAKPPMVVEEKTFGQNTRDLAARLFLLSQGLWPVPWERHRQEQGGAPESPGGETEVDEILRARAADTLQYIRETIEFERQNGGFTTVEAMKNRAVELALKRGAKLPKREEWHGSPVSENHTLPQSAGDMSGQHALLPALTPEQANTRLKSAISKSQSNISK